MFEIGDKVVCIDDSIAMEHLASVFKSFQCWPVQDQEYTIRDIFYNDDIVSGVVLQEMFNKPVFIPLLKREQEPAYAIWRFRKLEKAPIQVEEQECVVKIHGEEVGRMTIPYKTK